MEKLFDSLSNINVKKNDGYIFIRKDEVYIPIIRTYLSITKRSFYMLPLLDEIVLRLISEGMQEIDDLIAILGINRTLLEVTLADLNVKDIIYCTNNRCSLMAKGKEALRNLKTIQRRKDILKNIYLDPINRKVLVDYSNYQFIDRVYDYDKKLDANFEIDNIDVFKENMDIINALFIDEMNIYNDKTKAEPDELLSIDSIENLYPKFVRLPIYIYVSTTGYDIDILSVKRKDNTLLQQFKNVIIEQIREHKVLKNTFVKHRLRKSFPVISLNSSPEINDLLLKYKRNIGNRDILTKTLEDKIFSNRKLFDEEFDVLFAYFTNNSKTIEVSVSYLDDWAKKEFFINILSTIGDKKLKAINFAECYNFGKALSELQRAIPMCKNRVQKTDTQCYFSIIFDNQVRITGVPNDINVIDDKTYIYKMNFYLTYE